MSSLAPKFCDEIIDPALKSPKSSSSKKSTSKVQSQCLGKQDSKTTRSIIIEKKKVITKLDPNDSNASKTKFKSKEILLNKKFTDVSLNTLITGSLRCDNDCVTLVRKRDNKCSCKCAQKRLNCIVSCKQIQTHENRHFSLTDKACFQSIETSSCGTQYLEKLSEANGIIKLLNSGSTIKSSKDTIIKIQSSLKDYPKLKPEITNTSKTGFINYMGARRWALSQHPVCGPDF